MRDRVVAAQCRKIGEQVGMGAEQPAKASLLEDRTGWISGLLLIREALCDLGPETGSVPDDCRRGRELKQALQARRTRLVDKTIASLSRSRAFDRHGKTPFAALVEEVDGPRVFERDVGAHLSHADTAHLHESFQEPGEVRP